MKEILIAMQQASTLAPLLYGVPNDKVVIQKNPSLIISICLGAIAILIGIIVVIKKKIKRKKDSQNEEHIEK